MKNYFKSFIFSLLLTIFFIFILSILISTTSLSEKIIVPGIICISSFSIMSGGVLISRNKKEKGIINGCIVGILYMLTIYIVSSILTLDFSITMNSIIMIFSGIMCGMIGGIIGVNINN